MPALLLKKSEDDKFKASLGNLGRAYFAIKRRLETYFTERTFVEHE